MLASSTGEEAGNSTAFIIDELERSGTPLESTGSIYTPVRSSAELALAPTHPAAIHQTDAMKHVVPPPITAQTEASARRARRASHPRHRAAQPRELTAPRLTRPPLQMSKRNPAWASKGRLSSCQLEAVLYAKQAHETTFRTRRTTYDQAKAGKDVTEEAHGPIVEVARARPAAHFFCGLLFV